MTDRIEALRDQMREEQLDAVIIFGTDPHQSEYVSDRWRSREWITGFTGSAGTVVVTAGEAGLWTDSRYFIQASGQLEGSGVTLFRMGMPDVPDYPQWLAGILEEDAAVGVFADEVSVAQYRELANTLSAKGISLKVTRDLLLPIWTDRPAIPGEPVTELPLSLTGMSRKEKIGLVRREAAEKGAASVLISSLDDIAWLLNLRGGDVSYNPLFLAYTYITAGEVHLFGNMEMLNKIDSLSDEVTLHPYEEAVLRLKELAAGQPSVYLCPERVNMALYAAFDASTKVISGRDITTDLKSTKNEVELEGMRESHRQDGAALVSFLHWIDEQWDPSAEPLDEILLAEKLLAFRTRQELFITESFSPIAGFRGHGALAHYAATEESAAALEGNGLLVLDTGGQYRGGTTDVTRVLLFGEPTAGEIHDYTMVLKAHLALGRQKFPAGTCGYQLDTVARMLMWNAGMNYGHGTGHGVGHMLNVHEGPQRVSPHPVTVPLRPGMVVSNEPGLYREGEHGIRIENLVYVVEGETTAFGSFLAFENLTVCPYERRLIDRSLLTHEEIEQVDAYHRWVYGQLEGSVDKEALRWLGAKTAPL